MSIAEKLTQVAENVPKVYSAGQSSMVDPDKLIPKTVSGSYISVDDVSEIPHSVECKVESVNLLNPNGFSGGEFVEYNGVQCYKYLDDATNFTYSGVFKENTQYTFSFKIYAEKRVVDLRIRYTDGTSDAVYGVNGVAQTIVTAPNKTLARITGAHNLNANLYIDLSYTRLNEGTTALPYTPYVKPEEVKVTRTGANLLVNKKGNWSDHTEFRNVEWTVNADGTLNIVGTVGADNSDYYFFGMNGDNDDAFVAKETLTLSSNGKVVDTPLYVVGARTDAGNMFFTSGNTSINIPSGTKVYGIFARVHNQTVDLKNIYFMLNIGSTTTAYEPYNGQTLTPSADGTVEGMTSVSPYMNVFADTAGVNIEAEYNKSYGMQTEYDRFWDAYQEYGNRTEYTYAFAGYGWTDDVLQPKYDIKPLKGEYMFANARGLVHVDKAIKKAGIVFDTSNCTDFTNFLLSNTTVKTMPLIDISKAQGVTNLFAYAIALNSVKLIVSEIAVFKDSFNNCIALTDIEIFGVIGNSVDFRWSPLNKASITSIINALSTTATGQTLTLKLSAVNTAFETSAGAGDGSTSTEFAALVGTKTNWTITMI